jgi:putative transposase
MLFLWHLIDSVAASKSMRSIACGFSDITYIRLQQGWVYLAVFIDLFSRQVVGWALSRSLDHGLVLKALERARQKRKPELGLMIHSDRGVQYACTGFR